MEEYEKFKAANPVDEDGIQQGLLGLYRDNKVPSTTQKCAAVLRRARI